MLRNLQPLLDQCGRHDRPRQDELDEVGQFRARPPVAQPAFQLLAREDLSGIGLSGATGAFHHGVDCLVLPLRRSLSLL